MVSVLGISPPGESMSRYPEDYYEPNAEVIDIFRQAGLSDPRDYGGIFGKWKEMERHRKAPVMLLEYHFVNMDRETQLRASKTIRSLENGLFWDTQRPIATREAF